MNFDISGRSISYNFFFNIVFLPYLNKKKYLRHKPNDIIVYIKSIYYYHSKYQIHSCRLLLLNIL